MERKKMPYGGQSAIMRRISDKRACLGTAQARFGLSCQRLDALV